MGNLFIFVSIALNILGQTALKSGVNKLGALSMDFSSMFKAFTSVQVWTGLFLYFCSSIFWILALSRKDLSYAYPLLSLGYLAILVVSWFILKENVTTLRIFGVVLISLGVFLVVKSA